MNYDLEAMEENPHGIHTKEEAEELVEDWQHRLRTLFAEITAWAKANDWQVRDSGTVSMHDELMQKLGMAAIEQPTLRLDREDRYALFRPKALWVIGANGRIDFYTSRNVFVIVDRAEPRAAPNWTIFRATTKLGGDRFQPEMIDHLT
jgi:hypothetical protein